MSRRIRENHDRGGKTRKVHRKKTEQTMAAEQQNHEEKRTRGRQQGPTPTREERRKKQETRNQETRERGNMKVPRKLLHNTEDPEESSFFLCQQLIRKKLKLNTMLLKVFISHGLRHLSFCIGIGSRRIVESSDSDSSFNRASRRAGSFSGSKYSFWKMEKVLKGLTGHGSS